MKRLLTTASLFLLLHPLKAATPGAVCETGVRINEFAASNNLLLNDGDGNSSDWIELFNAGPGSVDLSGWYLTDSATDLNKWPLPAGTTIGENQYLLIFASGQIIDTYTDAAGSLHTNFKLSSDGEYLGLVQPDGATVISEFTPTYPQQFTDITYGVFSDGSNLLQGYLNNSTPEATNSGGSSNAGPNFLAVTHAPNQPSSSQNIVVSANLSPRVNNIGNVNLIYRVGYGSEVTIPMNDSGNGDDAVAGDLTYTATIPSSAYGAEQMVRWYVSASDTASSASRSPAFLDQTGDGQSPEYYGTVTSDPTAASDLPLFQWFTQNEMASHERIGTRASVFFLGRFYDNIFVRQRGGFTNAAVSQKFDFNGSDPLYINAELPAVGEININGNGLDSTYIRQPLGFDIHRAAGNESCLSYLWQLRVNGSSDRVGVAIEQIDENFLERYDYDPEGDLYKFVQRRPGNLNPNPPFLSETIDEIVLRPGTTDNTGVEKKIGEPNNDSIQTLIDNLQLANPRTYIIDNFDIPQIMNYLAARSIIRDADDIRKNLYLYLDTNGDRRWRQFPWDKDTCLGSDGDGGTFLPHPFYGSEDFLKQNRAQWNLLYDILFTDQLTSRLYLRRLRTLTDELLANGSPLLDSMAQNLIDPASPPLSSNISGVLNYFNTRHNELNGTYGSLLPSSQPANPDIVFGAFEQNPSNGIQRQEYITLNNNEGTEIDISGWSLSGGVNFTFRPGTVIPRNGELYVSPDLLQFLNRSTSPTAGGDHLVTGPYSGRLSNFSETITLMDANGATVSTLTTPNIATDNQKYLVISEINYHPADPNPDSEFIELLNTSDTVTLDLSGVQFTAGIDFTFPAGTTLAPGERILVVLDLAIFESVYGTGLNVAGIFQSASRLNNGSDHIVLDDALGNTIAEFTYDDEFPWPTGPDGNGFSLVLDNLDATADFDDPANWRESAAVGGNPGVSDTEIFTGDPLADLDQDSIPALAEYAFGTSDTVFNANPLQVVEVGEMIRISATLSLTAVGINTTFEHSSALKDWAEFPATFTEISRINNADGTYTVTYQTPASFLPNNFEQFFRLCVTQE